MSRFSVIDLSQLGDFSVVQKVDFENLVTRRMAKFKFYWTEADPPMGAQYDVDGLEFDPIKINQETNSYFHGLLEDRINQAAKGTTLAFATGPDLDIVASRYPGGVPRLPDEKDDAYRHRILLSSNAFSTAGSRDAYIFHALTAEPSLSDASAVALRPKPGDVQVQVTLLSSRPEMRPTTAEVARVTAYLNRNDIRPLTDVLQVHSPTILHTNYLVHVKLFPGPDRDLMVAKINASLLDLIERQRYLGMDHTIAAIEAAVMLPGVQNVTVITPAADIVVGPQAVVKVDEVSVVMTGRAE